MKLEIKRDILMEYLNYIIRGISTKNLRPILNCIKFVLNEDGLYMMSTDNEIAIKTLIKTKDIEHVENLGEIVVSGKYVYDIVRKMPKELITLEEVIGSKLYITATNCSFNLNCNNPVEFPDLEIEFQKNPVILNQGVFKTIINQTAFATSNSETRPILTGLNFVIRNNVLQCTGTDSYRLAIKTVPLNGSYDDVNIIIPTKNVNELVKMLNNDEEELEMHIFNNKVIFKAGNITMLTRLINGTYPDTSKLIPNEFTLEVKTDLENFYDAIDRASLLTNESDKNTIKLETNENEITISSNIPEIGNAKETVSASKNNESNIKIAFSSKFMLDALRVINSSEILLLFNGELKPIIIKDTANEDLVQLILPIRTY